MAGKVEIWKGVAVAMQSAIGTAVAITAISKASPGVVSASAHGFANGDYVLLSGLQGMAQVNNRILRVAASAAGTFALEGEDTTLNDTFISGNAQKLTFGTSFSTLLDCTVAGGDFSEIGTTTIHDNVATAKPGLPSALTISSNSIWDVSDPGLIAAKKASAVQAIRAFLITFQSGQKYLINGYIGCTLNPAGSAQEKVTTPIKITANGDGNSYAT